MELITTNLAVLADNARLLLTIIATGAGCVLLIALTVFGIALMLVLVCGILSDLDRDWEKNNGNRREH